MNWKIKAGIQKVLSLTRLGDKLNHLPATLSKEYHKNVFKYQSWEAIRRFDYCGTEFFKKERIALEIGTGYSLVSAITLCLLGFINFKKFLMGLLTKPPYLLTKVSFF